MIDGKITSTVDQIEKPTKDNQFDFGTGYKYRYGPEGIIGLYMNEKWWFFEVQPQNSALYSKEDSGCTLTSLEYAGDEISKNYAEWAERANKEVIVLISSFNVDSLGGGPLNPNSTYDDYLWKGKQKR